jgi:hypothetical protein
MDGSPIDLIVIPIVAVLSLVGWLVPIYWAASHPRWGAPSAVPSAAPVAVTVPPQLPRTGSGPQPPPRGQGPALVPPQRNPLEDPSGVSGSD